MRLLVAEDDSLLANTLASRLRKEGYAVDVATDGASAHELLQVESYDLAILDWNLPCMPGIDVIRQLRAEDSGILIIVLTARDTAADRVAGLDAGADDYVTKPFTFVELTARIRALLRRDMRVRGPLLRHDNLTLDPAEHAAWQGKRRLDLTRKEFAILEFLMRHPSEVVSQEDLLEHVWDAQMNPFTNVLTVHMSSLRRKLGDNSREPLYIRTVVGCGYQFVGEGNTPSGEP